MYADRMTQAMEKALGETNRRRAVQVAFNEVHGITPRTIVKGVSDITALLGLGEVVPRKDKRRQGRGGEAMSVDEMEKLIVSLEEEMLLAAEELRFEYAATLRDEIRDLGRELKRAVG
jgi:excinuclease ABC subunit B